MPDAKFRAAGVALVDPNGLALFLKRGADSDHPGEWCFPGGGIEGGESAEQAAVREVFEETGIEVGGPMSLAAQSISDEGVDFSTFLKRTDGQPKPTLNGEHNEFQWASLSDPPKPLHPGVEAVLPKLKEEADTVTQDGALLIALDRASVRKSDVDGHLHVELTPISKANVCPYYGRDITGWQKLGLDANRTYYLYRDPKELEKAADSFSGKPLLFGHNPVSAQDHDHKRTVGSVTGAVWKPPYLMARLDIWPSQAIDAIESGEHEQLSSGYRYRADMTPGKAPDGTRYDGVMRDIVGNHVALVPEGRAGPDVIVLDEKPKPFNPFGDFTMIKNVTTRGAAAAQTAIAMYLKPKLAQDAKVDVAPSVKGVTKKNFKGKKAGIAADLKKRVEGKLATDANIDDVTELLDALEDVLPIEVTEPEPVATVAANLDDEPAADAGNEEMRTFLTDLGISDEDVAKIVAKFGSAPDDQAAMDTKRRLDEKTKRAIADATKNTITKPAMDSAIKVAVDAATEKVIQSQREIRDAERDVRGRVGELSIAFDSADHVYRTALEAMKIDVSEIPDGAAKSVFRAIPEAAPQRSTRPTVAMDAAASKSFDERYPGAARIKIAS